MNTKDLIDELIELQRRGNELDVLIMDHHSAVAHGKDPDESIEQHQANIDEFSDILDRRVHVRKQITVSTQFDKMEQEGL